MQAHDVAMHETADKLCGIGTKLAISMCRFEEVSVSDQVRLRQLDQCPVKVLEQQQREISASDQERLKVARSSPSQCTRETTE